MKKPVRTTLIIFLIFSLLPAAAFTKSKEDGADENGKDKSSIEYDQGYAAGFDAAKGRGLWFLSGFFLPGIGIILPWFFSPDVPMDDLAGRSSDYVDGYTDGYKKRAKRKNFGWALGGTGASLGVLTIVGVIIVTKTAHDASIGCADAIGTSIGNSCGNACSPDLSCSNIPIFSSFKRAHGSE